MFIFTSNLQIINYFELKTCVFQQENQETTTENKSEVKATESSSAPVPSELASQVDADDEYEGGLC